jgi:hypothetical protein
MTTQVIDQVFLTKLGKKCRKAARLIKPELNKRTRFCLIMFSAEGTEAAWAASDADRLVTATFLEDFAKRLRDDNDSLFTHDVNREVTE